MLKKYVDVDYGEERKELSERKEPSVQDQDDQDDHIEAYYACNVLSSGLLLMEFKDAVGEGDGNRILRCWKYFLIHFKLEKRTNYSVEAFILLSQYHFLLSVFARLSAVIYVRLFVRVLCALISCLCPFMYFYHNNNQISCWSVGHKFL